MNDNPSFTLFLCRVLPLSVAAWALFAFLTHITMNLYQFLK